MAQIWYQNHSSEVFCGFYYSSYGEALENYCDSSEIPDGYCFDYKEGGWEDYKMKVAEKHAESIGDELKGSNPLGVKILLFGDIYSPREYNFTTDKITLKVDVNLNKLKRYCFKENAQDFDTYLNEHWSSYDGFISFVPHTLRGFVNQYREGKDRDLLQEVMLEYYFLKNINFDYVHQDVEEYLYEFLGGNVGLRRESDRKLFDYEWDNEAEKYKPTQEIE